MSRGWLIANGAMAVLFAVSAALQYNDPDPLGWAAIYAAAAAACVQAGRHRRDWIVPALVLLAALLWLATLTPDVLDQVAPGDLVKSMDDKGGSAELAREAGGLAIVAAWMAVVTVRTRR